MKRSTRTLVAAGLVAALASAARAEEPAAAGTAEVEVAPGARVRIRLDDVSARVRGERTLTGRLLETGPDRFVLASEREGQRIVVPRGAIERLELSHGRGHRGRSALKGFGIGAGLGVVVFGIGTMTCDRESWDCFGPAVGLMLGAPALGAAGAAIGAATGSERWEPVESARRPRLTVTPTLGKGVGARLALSF
jgi:hypothetical protein